MSKGSKSQITLVFCILSVGTPSLSFSVEYDSRPSGSNALDELIRQTKIHAAKIEPLPGPGFCNSLYDVSDDRKQQHYVAKIFSEMAKRRRPYPSFEADLLAAQHHVGPIIYAWTPNGILMECIDGTTLNETTIHNSNSKPLLQTIALQLRTLHSIPFKVEPNMLWYSLEAMLENTWSEELLQEYRFLHSHISPLPLHMCLGHGDFKPSNIVLHYDGLVRFIDFELSGLHYRGFDIAKLFRTDSVVNTDNRDFFINIYSDENSDLTEALQLEAAILEPMTWFEAAVFFDYAKRQDPSDKRWKDLFQARIESYESSLHGAFEDSLATIKRISKHE